jgi:uncharacterized lipoprotein YajG
MTKKLLLGLFLTLGLSTVLAACGTPDTTDTTTPPADAPAESPAESPAP